MHAYFSLERHHTVDSFQTGVRQVCGNYIVRSAATGDGSNPGDFPFVARTGLLRQPGAKAALPQLARAEIQIKDSKANEIRGQIEIHGGFRG